MILSHPWTVRQLTPYFPVTPYMPLMPYFPVTPYMPLMPCINGPFAAMDPAATRVKVMAIAAGAPLAASPVALSAAPLAPSAALVAVQGAPAAISTGLPLIAINAHQQLPLQVNKKKKQLPLQFAAAPHAAYVPMFGSVSTDVMPSANVRIDWKKTSKAHVGLKKEKVKVEVEEGRIVQISGERSKEQEEKNDKCHRVERSSGKFHRPFPLPKNAKMEEVKASMENGVLTVTVSKMEEKKQMSTPLKSLVKKLKIHCCCFKAFPPLNSNSRKQTKMILRVKKIN